MGRAVFASLAVLVFSATEQVGAVPFARGDTNGDGVLDIADAVNIMAARAGCGSLECLDAADVTDDGKVDTQDVVELLHVLCGKSGSLPPPWELPGPDPTPDDLGCPQLHPSFPQETAEAELYLPQVEIPTEGEDPVEVPLFLWASRPVSAFQCSLRVEGIDTLCLAAEKPPEIAVLDTCSGEVSLVVLKDLFCRSFFEVNQDEPVVTLRLSVPAGTEEGTYRVLLENVRFGFHDERSSFLAAPAESELVVKKKVRRSPCPAEPEHFTLAVAGPSQIPPGEDSFYAAVRISVPEGFQHATVALDFNEQVLRLEEVQLAEQDHEKGELACSVEILDNRVDPRAGVSSHQGFVVFKVEAETGELSRGAWVDLAGLLFLIRTADPSFPWAKIRLGEVGEARRYTNEAFVREDGRSERLAPASVSDLTVYLGQLPVGPPPSLGDLSVVYRLSDVSASPGQQGVAVDFSAESPWGLRGLSAAFSYRKDLLRLERFQPSLRVYGEEPDFFLTAVCDSKNSSRGALGLSVIVDSTGPMLFASPSPEVVARAFFTIAPSAQVDSEVLLSFCDTCCRDPGVVNGVVASGSFVELLRPPPPGAHLEAHEGRVRVVAPLFVRGDASGDAGVDIADPVYILSFLFAGGPEPRCPDAADANDDGTINISDPIAILATLFAGTRAIATPYPEKGVDLTGDTLGPCRL